MAPPSYQNCPICKDPIMPGDPRRIVSHDMTGWPDVPPISIYAHRRCIQATGFRGVAVITSVTHPGAIVKPGQPSLAL